MKKDHRIIILLLLFVPCTFMVEGQNLDEILVRYRKASGYPARLRTRTITSIGKLTQMGTTLPISIIQKQPDKYRMDVHLPGARITQAYDGSKGWSFNPFLGKDTLLLEGAELEQLAESSDFLGILNTYRSSGYKLQLTGIEKWQQTEVFNLMLSKPSGQTINFFIDRKTYLILKTEVHLKIDHLEIVAESWFDDYRKVHDMVLPYHIKNINGQMLTEIRIDTVRVNEPLDDRLFSTNK